MSFDEIKALVLMSLVEPGKAGRQLLSLRPPQSAVWTAMGLLAVLNGILYGLLFAPVDVLPPMLRSPFALAGLIGTAMVGMTVIMMQAGRLLGGTALLGDMALVVVWLQALRLAAQLAVSAISLLIPMLGGLLGMAAGFWGLFVLGGFLAAVHGFTGWGKPAALMLMTGLLLAFLLSFVLAAFGVAPATVEGTL
ncbi:YIP1 family protein [Pseudooceanicola nanhaiensis]|uniref:YIP1 family protein n=1 Tax=Pseudooceanicola nanhaiensis TaxID=375761 RepID=UPI001CD29A46|nr:YIP1 family protein [Pseudooceanicola nanhaiensis]MCA0919829.1 hypothetical protein [Pseudooceanicola nanhaiensis]